MIEIILGFLLDLIVGDPQNPIHPIRIIGSLCKTVEKFFRSILKRYLKVAGLLTWILVVFIVFIFNYLLLKVTYRINPSVTMILGSVMIYFCISTKALKIEGLKVVKYVIKDDIEGARKQLSYIVGRDTKNLDKESILKAVVETVAENMSDGVIAPLFYAGIGGAPLAFLYKAVNTMDSMFGYKNDKYIEFGYFPAKLDDVFNYIPARLSGYFIVVVSFILGLDYKNSFKIYKRDKNNHSSPNSAHPEAAVAGALNVQLGGPNYYFGKLVEKQTIGDDREKIDINKVNNTNNILYCSAVLGCIMALIINWSINVIF
ncbi:MULTISPECIES: adenosylcobinamide-phosphate synthase CbiB [Clostridium]|mgnify:FL=1|jgi:adenosylcobinamide-phosphate synthase|uniref:adenosylcobinamide-phosphate synthase CbiB n=1 Tax=Clostridium TaxID=1485 RepID=UPI0004B26F52|nr:MULTISPECIES: adenosylcobinamide-phosphate synthase CbiB [Clostridium]MBX9184700.1 cobalamin biosynthesis protein [Clostridium sp. K04]MDU7453448.1 adenosylcobinamide-phosphate synthase CbiB [Clostridium saudiense]CUO86747.1 cobalamin biosynthesis protein [Clostridium disporicum]SCJ96479.1 cobalamin biosynthesis protein [uncultured Clostridium sp.]